MEYTLCAKIYLVVCRMFRVFGHEKVWVLNGGLPKWQDAGFPVVSHESQLESSVEAVAAVKKVYSGQQVPCTSSHTDCHCFSSRLLHFMMFHQDVRDTSQPFFVRPLHILV